MAGFADIGDFFAGNHAGNELAYQKGMALGVNTQNAMAQARERVRQNTAIERLQSDPNLAATFGLGPMTDATITAMAGGLNPTQIMDTRLKGQEAGFRDIAGSQDPNVDAGARNRALAGVATGPVETFKAVGSKGYQDVFHPDKGVIPLGPEFNVGAGGGDAAAIQILRAFGMLDAQGHVAPGHEKQAFDVMRTTGHVTDLGGVPGVTDFNPFAGSPHAAAPAIAPGIGDQLAPPMPAMPTPVPAAGPASVAPRPAAPPAVAPPMAGTPAGTGVAQPISDAATVAANTAEIARAKAMGTAAGEAAAGVPDAMSDIAKLRGNVTAFLQKPGFSSVYGNIQGRGPVQTAMGLLSQDAADAQAALKNIDAQTFGIAIQKMRGLGQLSNAEGLKVTDAFTRASNPTISEPDARAAWQEVLTYLDAAEGRAMRKATNVPGAPAGGATPGAAVSLDDYLKSKGF